MSTSPARIEANRSNAENSTGPRTLEGKQRSASNSLRHGLTAKTPLLPTEDPQAYQDFCQTYLAGLQPQGALEEHLARTLADTQWRLERCRHIEQSILDGEPGPAQIDSLNKFSLYEHRLSRVFQTTLKQFLELKSARKLQEEKDLKDAAKVLKLFLSEKKQWDPAQDGFVFSIAQVETWLRRHEHVEAADQARMMRFNRQFFAHGSAS